MNEHPRHDAEAGGEGSHAAAKILAATGVLLLLLMSGFAITSSVLMGSLDRNVQAGMTRPEIEAYLGEPMGTMASTDEIPTEDRDRYDLPDIPAPGGIVSYKVRHEPEWLTWLPTALPLSWNVVFVYYDDNDTVLEVHVRNLS